MWCGIRQTIYEIELTPPVEREEPQHMKLRLDATEIVCSTKKSKWSRQVRDKCCTHILPTNICCSIIVNIRTNAQWISQFLNTGFYFEQTQGSSLAFVSHRPIYLHLMTTPDIFWLSNNLWCHGHHHHCRQGQPSLSVKSVLVSLSQSIRFEVNAFIRRG